MKNLTALFFCILFYSLATAQDLEKIGGSPFSWSGNVSVGSSFYHAIDRDNRRSPFAYFISANPTFSFYGIDVPVSIVYRDQQGSISNPFNRVSINPRYKWVSLHAGTITMQLSPYTLSGQLIKGGGVELTPGKFRVSAIAGKMQNPLAQLDTIVEGAVLLETYERNTIGGKIGFGSSRNYIDVMALHVKDDINSVDLNLINPRLVTPEENLVGGLAFKLSPFRFLSIHANAAASAHTANQESTDYYESQDLSELREQYGDLLTLNFSTKLQFAGDAGINFKFRNFGFGGEYKRVDPLYKSLGTYYFLEDYENLLFKVNFRLFRGKVRFSGRGGIQRNNLNNLRSVTNTRQIMNGSLTVAPSRSVSLTARYSNFVTDRSPGLVAVNDTLRFSRATTLYGIAPRFSFGSKDRRSSISASVNYQNLEDLLAEQNQSSTIDNYNANLTYSLNLKPSATTFSISILGNQNEIRDIERQRIGANLRFRKKMLDKKLRLTLGGGLFQNFLNQKEEGQSYTGRFGISYKLKNAVNLSVNTNYLNRVGDVSYQEFRGSVKMTFIWR